MPDIWMDVDAALSEVPVNVLPLLDDSDFKTRETAIVYNQAGMDLVWNFVTPAGAFTQTAVTPTTGGAYDWANQGDGMYTIEIPASGGGSINNDTEGFGWFTGICTGVLPWRGPVIGFRSAALNNALVEGTDLLDVNTKEISDVSTAADNLETACGNYSATRGLAGTALPNAAADAAGGLPISDAGGLDLDTLASNIAAILVDTGTDIPATLASILADTGTDIPALIAALNDLSSTEAQAAAAAALTAYDPPTKTEMDTGFAGLNDLSAAEVNAEVDIAFADYDPPTKAEMDTGFAGLNDLSSAEVQGAAAAALTAYDPPTKAELDSAIAGLNDISPAEVNAEVLDVLNVDTFGEPGQGAPPATASIFAKINYLYKFLRNKITNDGSNVEVYNDAGAVVDHKAAVSEAAGTVTRGEFGTGP